MSVDQLLNALAGDDWQAVVEAIATVEASDDWPAAIDRIARTAPPAPAISAAFHTLWTERGHRIREQVANDEGLLDALRILLPSYIGPAGTLYRGENAERWRRGLIGLAWTPDKEIARTFAEGLNAEPGGGLLLCTEAPADAIIAGPGEHSIYLQETEFVVDSRRLTNITILEWFPKSSELR